MNRALQTWLVPLVMTLTICSVLAWRHQASVELEEQLVRERQIGLVLDRGRTAAASGREEEAARANTARAEIPTAEDEASLAQLRKEIAELKERAAARAQEAAARSVASDERVSPITERMVPFAQWRNAGDASPVATLETALWAASGGDVETLSGLLSMDPVVRTKANALLIQVPGTLRRDYDTAERLVALLAATDVPLGAAQIRENGVPDATGKRLVAIVRDTQNRSRTVNLNLQQEGERWKIVVPGSAIDRYAAMLERGKSK